MRLQRVLPTCLRERIVVADQPTMKSAKNEVSGAATGLQSSLCRLARIVFFRMNSGG